MGVIFDAFCKDRFELYISNKHLVCASLPTYLFDLTRRDLM